MVSAAQLHSWSSSTCHQPHSLHARVMEPAMQACVTTSLRLAAAHWTSLSITDGHLQFWSTTGPHTP